MRVALLVEIGIALAAAAVVLVHASRNGSFTFPRFDPDRPNPGWPFGYAPAVGGLVSLASMFSLVTGISWLVWQHRAHTNVWALPTPTRPEFSPGWAVGWWFVPLANLVLPVLTMRETSRRSAEATGRTASPITLAAWWGCWVATSVGTIAGVFAVLGSSRRSSPTRSIRRRVSFPSSRCRSRRCAQG